MDEDAAQFQCTATQPDDLGSRRLVTYRPDELRPHPSYVQHHLTVPSSQMSALIELGDVAFQEPIVITSDRTILDGYGRVKLALLKGRPTLLCLVQKPDEEGEPEQ